jgi:hypothetical protein
MPLTVRDAPYQTTLTTLLQTVIPFIQFSYHIPHRFVRRLPRSVPGTPLVLITDPGHVSIHRTDEPSPDLMHTLLQWCTVSVQVLSRLSMSIPNNHELHLARTSAGDTILSWFLHAQPPLRYQVSPSLRRIMNIFLLPIIPSMECNSYRSRSIFSPSHVST